MTFVPVKNRKDLSLFYSLGRKPYRSNPFHRITEEDVVKLVMEGSKTYRTHARLYPFLIKEGAGYTGRFCLIQDALLKDYVQLAFFELTEGGENPLEKIKTLAKEFFPECSKIIAGIGGHINYTGGYLLDHFESPPLFGLSYTHKSYPPLFKGWEEHKMFTFRFPTAPFFNYLKGAEEKIQRAALSVRPLDKKNLKRDIDIYTKLNNLCFAEHPFWAPRHPEEDYELFHPFRFLIKEENLLFLEKQGKPIGFYLWYPDFNTMVKHNESLGLPHLLRYRFKNPIKTFRFTQIGILPEYRNTPGTLALIAASRRYIEKGGFTHGEGGFIFEQNKSSMNMAYRYLKRSTGESFTTCRTYGIFEQKL